MGKEGVFISCYVLGWCVLCGEKLRSGMLTLKDDRIIGWIKKGVLTKGEEAFCLSVYGEGELSDAQWRELRRINLRNHPGKL